MIAQSNFSLTSPITLSLLDPAPSTFRQLARPSRRRSSVNDFSLIIAPRSLSLARAFNLRFYFFITSPYFFPTFLPPPTVHLQLIIGSTLCDLILASVFVLRPSACAHTPFYLLEPTPLLSRARVYPPLRDVPFIHLPPGCRTQSP